MVGILRFKGGVAATGSSILMPWRVSPASAPCLYWKIFTKSGGQKVLRTHDLGRNETWSHLAGGSEAFVLRLQGRLGVRDKTATLSARAIFSQIIVSGNLP